MSTGPASPKPPAPEASSGSRRPGQARLVLLVAVVIAAAAVAFAVSRVVSPAPRRAAATASLPTTTRPPTSGSMSPDRQACLPAGGGLREGRRAAAEHRRVLQRLDAAFRDIVRGTCPRPRRGHDRADRPDLRLVPRIAAGVYDGYLRSYADSVRDFGHPVIIGFGHEMNAPWYSWGYGHVPPATFVAAWRHVVTLFRGQGADNVTWLWTIQADTSGTGPVALLVARRELCHLGRHRRLLLPPVRYLRQRLRPRPLPRSGSSRPSRCCCRRPPWGPGGPGFARSGICSPG